MKGKRDEKVIEPSSFSNSFPRMIREEFSEAEHLLSNHPYIIDRVTFFIN